MKLKIVSLNLAGFKDWETRQQKVVDFLNEARPDVVLLQEVKFDPLQSAHSQSVLINRLIGSPFSFTQTTISKFYQPSHGDPYREGLATLSKFPITNSEALVLAKRIDDKHPRIVQNVDVLVDGRTITLSNIHFSNNQYSQEQLRELLGILESRGEQRIIAGDFNIFHLEELSESYKDKYAASIDFKKYISFPIEGHTLDYVLVPRNVAFKLLEAIEGMSDHNALLFILEFPEGRA